MLKYSTLAIDWEGHPSLPFGFHHWGVRSTILQQFWGLKKLYLLCRASFGVGTKIYCWEVESLVIGGQITLLGMLFLGWFILSSCWGLVARQCYILVGLFVVVERMISHQGSWVTAGSRILGGKSHFCSSIVGVFKCCYNPKHHLCFPAKLYHSSAKASRHFVSYVWLYQFWIKVWRPCCATNWESTAVFTTSFLISIPVVFWGQNN